MEGGTTFTFVTEGIESALEQARAAAGGGEPEPGAAFLGRVEGHQRVLERRRRESGPARGEEAVRCQERQLDREPSLLGQYPRKPDAPPIDGASDRGADRRIRAAGAGIAPHRHLPRDVAPGLRELELDRLLVFAHPPGADPRSREDRRLLRGRGHRHQRADRERDDETDRAGAAPVTAPRRPGGTSAAHRSHPTSILRRPARPAHPFLASESPSFQTGSDPAL